MPSSVAVIIPLYNKRQTIERTLDSVLAQTHREFEVVVVDDGSTDGGDDLVRSMTDPRLRLVRQANAGPGAARNHGLRIAQADLVCFLDADDVWFPDHLATVVRTLETYPECAAFTAAFTLGGGEDRWASLDVQEGPWRLTPDAPDDVVRDCTNVFHAVTAAYRRPAVVDLGGFFEERCTLGEDIYLWIKILLNHPIYRHVRPLGHYHTEDSELGIGARTGYLPLEPTLTHPEGLRQACPPAMRPVLERWLGWQALRGAFRADPATARRLLSEFPAMRSWPRDCMKLRLRLFAPILWRLKEALNR